MFNPSYRYDDHERGAVQLEAELKLSRSYSKVFSAEMTEVESDLEDFAIDS
jgi:hypothetical protein